MGMKGYVKEGLELTPMGSFDIGQGGESTPDLIVTELLSGRTLHGVGPENRS